jgi:hypothetical protein
MAAWTSDELDKISAADELELTSAKRDGTLRRPVTIWVVRHGEDLYVRSWRGRTSTWFRGSQDRHEGHIRAGGVEKDVVFAEVDDVNDEIDAAYRAKVRPLRRHLRRSDGRPERARGDDQARAAIARRRRPPLVIA